VCHVHISKSQEISIPIALSLSRLIPLGAAAPQLIPRPQFYPCPINIPLTSRYLGFSIPLVQALTLNTKTHQRSTISRSRDIHCRIVGSGQRHNGTPEDITQERKIITSSETSWDRESTRYQDSRAGIQRLYQTSAQHLSIHHYEPTI
jgi:hypothetical protein